VPGWRRAEARHPQEALQSRDESRGRQAFLSHHTDDASVWHGQLTSEIEDAAGAEGEDGKGSGT
jgi:hypothetical protein